MKQISWKKDGTNVWLHYYCDDTLTKQILGQPKSASFAVNPGEWNSTPDEFISGIKKYCSGELVQNALPTAPDTVREFLISGLVPEEQKEIFKPC